jgi:hypothetical protein
MQLNAWWAFDRWLGTCELNSDRCVVFFVPKYLKDDQVVSTLMVPSCKDQSGLFRLFPSHDISTDSG